MKKAIKITILVIILVAIIAPIAIYAGLYYIMPDRYNILIVGSDQRDNERSRSDVMMVFSFPKDPSKKASLITIPRDSRVEIEGHGLDKLTHAYSYGELEEGGSTLGNIDLTRDTIENFLDIEIHGTLEFTFESFKDIVDMVGGVWLEDGYYDGDKALAQVRNRYREGGDFARTNDQREIVKSVMTKLKSKDKAFEVYDYFKDSDQGYLDINERYLMVFGGVSLIRRGGKMSLGEVDTAFVEGEGDYIYTPEFGHELYFWIIDDEKKEQLVNEKLR